MKTLNTTFIVVFSITLLLTGCMPDSLTKYKKDPPKKSSTTSKNASNGTTTVNDDIDDGGGGTVSLPSLVDPTYFTYTGNNDLIFVKDVEDQFEISGDNSFATLNVRNSLIKSCTISPALPTGLRIDSTTCLIHGISAQVSTDPLTFDIVNKGKKNYTVTATFTNRDGGTSTLSTPIKLQVLEKIKELQYSQSSRVILKVNGLVDSFITPSGDIISDDGKAPSDGSKFSIIGTVETIDSGNNLIGVINKKTKDYQGNLTNFTDANTDYQPDSSPTNPKYYFGLESKIDSDNIYYQGRATIKEVRNIFPTYAVAPSVSSTPSLQPLDIPNSGLSVNNLTSSRNYVEYTISPKLPTGFSLDPLTGKISGYSAVTLPMTTYQITASNAISAVSYNLQFAAIEAPTHISNSRKQLLTVNALTYSYLKEGDYIVSPIVGIKPSIHGIITKMIPATYQLEVLALDGAFAKNTQIDLGKTFNALLGTIINDPINFNAAIVTAAPVSIPAGGVAVGDMYAFNPSTSAIVTSRVYVASTNLSNIQSGASFLTSSISEIDAESLKIHMTTDPAPDLTGLDIISSSAHAYGYIYEDAGTDIYVSGIFRSINTSVASSRNFRHGDSLKFDERISGAGPTATIAATTGSVSFNNYIFFQRGIYSEFSTYIAKGSGVTYSITPSLPSGITLNPITGLISGTPTVRSEKKSYVLTAANLLGSSSVTLVIETRDYFSLEETSGAPSFRLHKVGDYQNDTACRVNVSDIYNQTGNLNIRCFMDGEEQDIYSFGMKLKAAVGPGACQFVSITPYSFWTWAPKQTNGTVVRWVNLNNAVATDREITTEQDCDGNYESLNGPNCDEGSITVNTYQYDAAAVAPLPTTTYVGSKIVKCGGKKINCIGGAIKDILTPEDLAIGKTTLISNSDNGFTKSWAFTSPISHSDLKSNLRIVNNTYVNSVNKGSKCSASEANLDSSITANYDLAYYPILDTTGTFYDVNTETVYKSTSGARGFFETDAGNHARSPKPYKKVLIESKLNPFHGRFGYYQVSCLDAAQEARAVITVTARDWNQKFKLQHEIDKEDPDTALAAIPLPILMRATGGTVINPVNDYHDWNDASPLANHPSCGTPPAYTIPASPAAISTIQYPAAGEFKFPGEDYF